METYEDIDFTYGEQPTEAKWDQLGLNDKRFNEILTYGWQDPGETWTYASATTFTVSGDVTNKYAVGDKIKLTQTTVKYFYITAVSYGSPNTTITVNGGDSYTLANAAITANYYSKDDSPVGFPLIKQPEATKYQNDTASNIHLLFPKFQSGWAAMDTGAGGGTLFTKTITFPVAFTTIRGFIAFPVGYHGSYATRALTAGGSAPGWLARSYGLSNSQATVAIEQVISGTAAADDSLDFCWIAWGE